MSDNNKRKTTMFDIFIGVLLALMIYGSVGAPKGETRVSWWRAKYDQTDDVLNKKRSGLAVYTDFGTGCQYIRTMQGSLTPRLDRDGKIMCERKTNDQR